MDMMEGGLGRSLQHSGRCDRERSFGPHAGIEHICLEDIVLVKRFPRNRRSGKRRRGAWGSHRVVCFVFRIKQLGLECEECARKHHGGRGGEPRPAGMLNDTARHATVYKRERGCRTTAGQGTNGGVHKQVTRGGSPGAALRSQRLREKPQHRRGRKRGSTS